MTMRDSHQNSCGYFTCDSRRKNKKNNLLRVASICQVYDKGIKHNFCKFFSFLNELDVKAKKYNSLVFFLLIFDIDSCLTIFQIKGCFIELLKV